MSTCITTAEAVEIAAPAELVWKLASDIPRYAEWVGATLAVTGGDAVACVGATYTERNRLLGPLTGRSTWIVAEADPSRGAQTHVARNIPTVSPAMASIRVEPLGPSTTRFTLGAGLTVSLGPLTRLVAPALARSLARENAKNAHAFARLAEAAAGTSAIAAYGEETPAKPALPIQPASAA
jgi:hypothetical protein